MKLISAPILVAVLVLGGLFFSCQKLGQSNPSAKGGTIKMKLYPIGRFSIGLPAEMNLIGMSHRMRDIDIVAVEHEDGKSHSETRTDAWNSKVAEIKKIRPIAGHKSPIIEQREFHRLGQWAKGILYHDYWDCDNEAMWVLLVDYGSSMVWFNTDGAILEEENMGKVVRNLNEVAGAYHSMPVGSNPQWEDSFYVTNGAIHLPYEWDEHSSARFEGHPLDLEVEVEMKTTYIDEPKGEGLFGRTAAAIASGYMAGWGVNVKKIRAQERVVAGLKGEDQVIRLSSRSGKDYDFTWRFAGRKNSGEYPEIMISMRSPEGNLEEKLKIWDAILDSVKPLYKVSP
ncbi:T6SS immunity protein Tli4 family protein [Geomesophilobacter sediminis]|uniref:Tle cognate immunity protein 4 C-terminal domain-containing protein n=1 Tax=Geomesophilobacter sediminis TaxID=2798584 RepID=A0A8J7JEA1_9BACT|nr:T6SS immunity protein Tli4 family protein [Geomesophilobacter sediminis]MBJ6725586.1 hypothetical protein [Geomesophilobacter sediminis]